MVAGQSFLRTTSPTSMRRILSALVAAALTLGGAGPAPAQEADGYVSNFAPHAMVAAANPLAVEAGLNVLRAGGSAMDAAVAVQAVLGLVEPQSSGLGGGAYMIYYDGKTHRTTSYDGREIAPAGATPDMFLGPDGKPMSHMAGILTGRSTGVPGAVAMLALAQKQHGKKRWSSLFVDAERLASDGFIVSPRLDRMIHSKAPQASEPDVVAYFTKPDGTKYVAGDRLKNPAYAAVVRRLASEGPGALYAGKLPAEIAARVQAPPTPGTLSVTDFAAYSPRTSDGLCRPYRVYVVCVPQDPSGGSALLEGLGILARTDIDKRGPSDPQAWYEFSQASRLMYADRDFFIGDPAFVTVPTEGLLEPAYLDERAKLIGPTAGPAPEHGQPRGAPHRGPDATAEPGGTSSFAIVDTEGNVVSMTTTVESVFGSGRMVEGMMLNNQLTDFSFSPKDAGGYPVANAVAARKRPRSSMAPAIVLDQQGRFVAAVGSPGGPAILAYNLKALVGFLDWKLPMAQALALPNLICLGNFYIGEASKFPPEVAAGLKARGVVIQPSPFAEDSGLHGIAAKNGGYEGGADPRREGVARGF
jgi:gamma-glutamyltranspeptidase/glutathione hydrolase